MGEVMLEPADFVQLYFRVRQLRSEGNGDPEFYGGAYGFASNNREFLLYGTELALWITHGFGVNAGVTAIDHAKNMPSALRFSAGVFLSVAPSGTR